MSARRASCHSTHAPDAFAALFAGAGVRRFPGSRRHPHFDPEALAASQCHRRLVADALVARQWAVDHIGPDGDRAAHVLTPFAVVANGAATYPAAQLRLA